MKNFPAATFFNQVYIFKKNEEKPMLNMPDHLFFTELCLVLLDPDVRTSDTFDDYLAGFLARPVGI